MEYLRDLVERALDEVAVPDAVDVDIDQFRDVMIAGGSVLRLHKFLADDARITLNQLYPISEKD